MYSPHTKWNFDL